ncbi:MAG TPA: ABC transporter ATP-binding protein [Thermoanaerobaculia bacterium]|nr:ABC transporter ATP-binding protein [Thermoanaerobaculia bacterium]
MKKRNKTPKLTEVAPSLWRTWRHLWPWVRKQRSALLVAFAAMAVSIVFRLLEPWPLKIVFDGVFATGGAVDPLMARLNEQLGAYGTLLFAAVAIIIFTALRAIADFFNTLGLARVGNRVLTSVRNELFRHLQRLSLSFHSEARSGDLILRVIRDVSFLKDAAVTAAMPLVSSLLLLVAMITVMLVMDWRLALVALAPMPLLALSAGSLTRKIKAAAKIQRTREGALAASATESIGSIKVVQALSLEERFAESFSTGSQKSGSEDLQVRRLSARLERSVDVMIGISTALVLSYGGLLVLRNQLTPGDLLVFITYLRRAFNPVQNFAKYTGRLAKAAAAGERVTELLDTLPEVRDSADAVPARPLSGGVSFDNVTFQYDPGQSVLSGLSFDTRPGEWIALVGPSGSGKSTITSLILRLYDPQQGRVLFDGRDVREYTIASVRAQISVVLQESILFAASVWENIGIARPGTTREEVVEAARLAHADELIRRLPHGYDTVLGERGVTLSGGERQRIAIARAAVRNAPILILDEPTTGLDEENEQLVIEALERLTKDRTVFVVSHDLSFAARADRILVLEKGSILEEGSHRALMQSNGRYATLYRLQSAIASEPEEINAGT